jgi:hypothetical protein
MQRAMRTLALLLLLAAPALAEPSLIHVAEPAPEAPSGLARGSIVVGQALGGLVDGAALCALSDCSPRTVPLTLALGAAAGVAEGALVFPHGITEGEASAVNSGTLWGLSTGLMLYGVVDPHEGEDDFGTQLAGYVLAGSLVGTGAGLAVAALLSPTAGHVALADAGYLWAGVLTGVWLGAAEVPSTTGFALELAATNLGGAVVGCLGRDLSISQGRVLLIDAGGLVGGLVGLAAAYASSESVSGGLYAASTSAGLIAGLATATWLTRDFDAPAPAITVAPGGPHGTPGASLTLRF